MSVAKFTELRKRAQEFLSSAPSDLQPLSQGDVKKLVEELNTYQIELELQNEDLRQIQLELEQSRSRISDLYDFSPIGYLTVSEKGLIVEANLKISDMLCVDRMLLLSQPLSAFIIYDDQDLYYRCRRKLLDTREPQICQLRMRKKDDTIFYAEFKSVIKDDIDGKSGQFRIAITDITIQKTTEDALVRAKTEWEQTFDSISDIITLQDQNFTILRANKAACDFFQTDYDTIIGVKCYELFSGTLGPCLNCPVMDTLASKDNHSTIITHEIFNKTFMVSSSPLPDVSGHTATLVHVAKDITEQISNEEKIRQAQKMESIGNLAGGIAHEFNNMLAIMIGNNELIMEELPENSLARENAKEVQIAGLRARDVVKQLLTFSRQDNTVKEVMDFKIVVQESMKLIRSSTPINIKIEQELSAETYPVMGNATQINQILINVCNNAVDALPEKGGLITIELLNETIAKQQIRPQTTLVPGQYAKLIISDNGSGMDKEVLNRVFEPYFTTKKIGEGTGIGMALVYGIVERHDGAIIADSQPGNGTTITILFPAHEGDVEVVTDNQNSIPTGAEHILFVDDEPSLARLGKRILDRLGYTTESTTDPEKALEMIRSEPDRFDLVISDMAMPNMTGDQLVLEILKIRQDMPMIICTGYSAKISEKEGTDIGVRSYLMKPIVSSELAQVVQKVLDGAERSSLEKS